MAQSLDTEQLEVIAVDDGSTDGSAEVLERFAELYPETFRLIRIPASGGPSAPRNRGLESARGRYVFFLDADDYIGTEALERMTTFADECGSDIVLGNVVGRGGRRINSSMYRGDIRKADLYSTTIYWQIEPWKLFRREFLDSINLRFPLGVPLGEDQTFTFKAYTHASTISILSSYTCLYQVLRSDFSNLVCETGWSVSERCRLHFDLLEKMTDLVGTEILDERHRDHLMTRHWEYEGYNLLLCVNLLDDRASQLEYLEGTRSIMSKWYSTAIHERLDTSLASVYEMLLEGNFDRTLELIEPFEATFEDS
jgi:CDP-glycerol glycerophosphotransferase